MAAARFFVDAPLVSGTDMDLPEAVAHHAARVLRLRDGAAITLFDGTGGEFAATLALKNGRDARALIGEHHSIERESPLKVTLVQSWIASDKLDWMIEKAVELGVASVVLAPAQRSVVRAQEDRAAKKLQRLREIAITACAQCGRNRIPIIESFSTLADALSAGLRGDAMGLLLSVGASSSALLEKSVEARSAAVAVGPEGGFTEDEVKLGTRLGFRECHLGPRVLRTETAGIAALAALQSAYGDLR